MDILDSNILIYAGKRRFTRLRSYVETEIPSVSMATFIEVMGYPDLDETDARFFESYFSSAHLFTISDAVADGAVALKRLRRIKLGDAIIAATALLHDLTLATNNESDFAWISGLRMRNPLIEFPPEPDATTPAP